MYRSPYLQGYIDLSLEVIEDGDAFMAEKLHDIIISVFENEIENNLYSFEENVTFCLFPDLTVRIADWV